MSASHDELLLQTIKNSFNNPVVSDLVLVFNGEKYYLLASLVKQIAPLLYEEVEKQQITSSTPENTDNDIVSSLTNLIVKLNKKQTAIIADSNIPNPILCDVLESIYGKVITLDDNNVSTIYALSERFGMNNLLNQCVLFLDKNFKLESLLTDLTKATTSQSPLTNYYNEKLIKILK